MSSTKNISLFILYCGDTAIITLPFWFIRRRWWLTLIPVWGLAVFLLANILNFRFWGDFLSFNAVTMAGNVGSLLINSIVGLLKFSDVIYLIVPSAYTIYLILSRRHIIPDKINILYPILFSIGLFVLGQAAITRSYIRWKNNSNIPHGTFVQEAKHRMEFLINRTGYLQINGLTAYFIKNSVMLVDQLFGTKKLSTDEKEEVENFIQNFNHYELADSFSFNRAKNLVIIVVESLNANVINLKVNGLEITPTMNSLLDSVGTISTLNMLAQVKDGGSSDGQMIINTGLLPLKDGAAAMRYGSKNAYPSIIKEFNAPYSLAVFGDDGAVWNQVGAFESYGFNEILCSRDFISSMKERGHDGAMFDLALEKLRNYKGQFVLECITNSMHVPFEDQCVEVPEELSKASVNDTEKNYYAVTRYFDYELGKFLNELYKISPKENTVVVITSDHCQGLAAGSNLSQKEDTNIPIVFMAINTGKTTKINRISGQVNIYPTLLEIMGITNAEFGYRGLAKSLLNQDVNGAVDILGGSHGNPSSESFKEMDISDNILKSDYFILR
ncbi:MAG: sulfatase-like hydrolase/transferase [Prevotella sp.]|nr:sulfatase-like hydrolase/transferase [Bacteroides sp.]MCM1446088.1 sulfatase-like hydrolase/transferase [Prevotella sp.]